MAVPERPNYGYRRTEPPSFELIDDVLAVRDLIVGAQMRYTEQVRNVVARVLFVKARLR